jgi:hypothetical protein
VVDGVGERDLSQRLAGVHALKRLACLVRRQLARAAEQHAIGLGALRPSLVRAAIVNAWSQPVTSTVETSSISGHFQRVFEPGPSASTQR